VTAIAVIVSLVAGAAPPASAAPATSPLVGLARAADGNGYWLVGSDGNVYNFGDAQNHGSMSGQRLNAPVVGTAATPDGGGYWEVAGDGGIFNFGDAQFYGSMGGQHLNAPVVGIAATPDGKGYWEVAADGGIFAFGDAQFHGSMGGQQLNAPVVGIAATPDGGGYWEVAGDGGIFAFGDAQFYGSMGGQHLNAPVVGIAATPDGRGYWEVASDGGIFAFGTAGFFGNVQYAPQVTAQMLSSLFGRSSSTISAGLPSLNASMANAGITTPARIAALLATLQAESGFRYNAVEACTSKQSYYPYCGHGFIQLTGKPNYQAASAYFNHDFVDNMGDAASLTYSASIMTWFWTVSHNLDSLADAYNMAAVTRAVNGTAATTTTLNARCASFKQVLAYYGQSLPAGAHCAS
jgi:predicted chitinase